MKKALARIARKLKQIGYFFMTEGNGIIIYAMNVVQIQKLKNL